MCECRRLEELVKTRLACFEGQSNKRPFSTIMNTLLSLAIFAGLFCASSQRVPPVDDIPVDKRYCWTGWFDRDNPSGTGDWELLVNLWTEYPGQICDRPARIRATTLTGTPAANTGDVYSSSATVGFSCRNNQQTSGLCHDYRVSFYCPCNEI